MSDKGFYQKISVYSNSRIEEFAEEVIETFPEHTEFVRSLVRLKEVGPANWVEELKMSPEQCFRFVGLGFQGLIYDCIEGMLGYNTLWYAALVSRRLDKLYGKWAFDPGPDVDPYESVPDWPEQRVPVNFELRTMALLQFVRFLDGQDLQGLKEELSGKEFSVEDEVLTPAEEEGKSEDSVDDSSHGIAGASLDKLMNQKLSRMDANESLDDSAVI